MTNLILINKKDVTSHENTGSAFLSFDTRRVIKKPRWYVNNSNQMRSEILKPMADKLNLDTKDILVKSSLDAPEISTMRRFYYSHAPLYIFFSVDDFRNNKGNNLLDYLINEKQAKLAEKSIKENENLKDDDSDSKGGFFSKLFGKK